jgi:6-phosphogluconolactonase
VKLSPSNHPGLAARSFAFDPSGSLILVADRPAHRVRSYSVCRKTGALTWLAEAPVPDPAYITFVEIEDASQQVLQRP